MATYCTEKSGEHIASVVLVLTRSCDLVGKGFWKHVG